VTTWPCAAVPKAPLAARTTLRVGGTAEWLLEPASSSEMAAAVQAVRERGMNLWLLGGGANLVIADGELPGAVIATDRLKRVWRWHGMGDPFAVEIPPEHFPEREIGALAWLVAWAGESMPGLVNRSKALGWTGIEGLAGVPGSLGGGVAMNAGGSWGELWDSVERVRILEPDGTIQDHPREAFTPSYRNAHLGPRIVLGAVLRLEQSHKIPVEAKVREYLEHKRRVQPVTEWSAGCIFKNPPKEQTGGKGAGQLIDEAGLKGRSIGDAQISPLHGNFLVNRGNATAEDVISLIHEIAARVADRTGIHLEREVKLWPAGGALQAGS